MSVMDTDSSSQLSGSGEDDNTINLTVRLGTLPAFFHVDLPKSTELKKVSDWMIDKIYGALVFFSSRYLLMNTRGIALTLSKDSKGCGIQWQDAEQG